MDALRRMVRRVSERTRDALASLNPRDRVLLLGLVAACALAVVVGGTLFMLSSLREARTRAADRAESLKLVYAMADEHGAALDQAKAIEGELQRHAGTDLSAFLEKAADRTGISDRLDSVREKSSSSDGTLEEKLYAVSLSRLTQEEMTSFLYEIETAGYPLRIRTAKVKVSSRGGETVLGLTMDIAAFRLAEAEERGEDGG